MNRKPKAKVRERKKPDVTLIEVRKLEGEFIGLQAPVTVGLGYGERLLTETYVLDFAQTMAGFSAGENRIWKFSCCACKAAEASVREIWQTDSFITGTNYRDCPEEEQQQQYLRVLEQIREHVALHQRMATWYEMLAQPPAYKHGVRDEMARGMARE